MRRDMTQRARAKAASRRTRPLRVFASLRETTQPTLQPHSRPPNEYRPSAIPRPERTDQPGIARHHIVLVQMKGEDRSSARRIRSEKRRLGKECVSRSINRRSLQYEKKKNTK